MNVENGLTSLLSHTFDLRIDFTVSDQKISGVLLLNLGSAVKGCEFT